MGIRDSGNPSVDADELPTEQVTEPTQITSQTEVMFEAFPLGRFLGDSKMLQAWVPIASAAALDPHTKRRLRL